MKVEQIASFTNEVVQEILGEETVVQEDLSNIVDIGKELQNLDALENAMRKLHDKVGRTIVVNREWKGSAPDILRDSVEFGSIREKITPELPTATDNETWELEDGASYDPNIYTAPSATAKYWDGLKAFEIPMSRANRQIMSAFNNPATFNAFWSGIETAKRNAMRLRTDAMIQRTLNNFAAETVKADYGTATIGSKSGIKAVNLLYLYNQQFTATLTPAQAMFNAEFLRFATTVIQRYIDRMKSASTLFNIGGTPKQTLRDDMHVVLHSDFISASDNYLRADVFHNMFMELPFHDTVSMWQGSGTDFDFSSTGKIDVVTSSGDNVVVTGVLGMIFDRDGAAVCNENYRVTGRFNDKAEFFNTWDKWEANYINDFNENFVVFFIA